MAKINLKNRTIFCSDNLEILENINSDTVDLIYLDPPFNKKKVFTAPIGSQAEGADFSDIFREEDVKDDWVQTIKEDNFELHNFLLGIKTTGNNYNYCYLCYMAIRLIECHRILKDTGSLYLHCDQTMSHYLKIVLDYVFDENNFLNELNWKRYAVHSLSNKRYDCITDKILYFCKNNKKCLFKRQSGMVLKEEMKEKFKLTEENTNRKFQHVALEQSSNKSSKGEIRKIQGKEVVGNIGWRWTQETFDERIKNNPNIIYWTQNGRPRYKIYEDEYKGNPIGDFWDDIDYLTSRSNEDTGYPTQKPLALLERIIKASSKEGDLVLDPFCGCATTCIASEKLGRQWVGIDVSKKAYELVKKRLKKEIPDELLKKIKVNFCKTKKIKRTDGGGKYKEKKYVYIIEKESELPYYKVGIAKDWKSRLNSYQTGDKDRDYKIVYKLLTKKYREIEKHIHSRFESLHEWVKAKVKDIKKEIIFYDTHPITAFGESEIPESASKLKGKEFEKAKNEAIEKDAKKLLKLANLTPRKN